MSSHGYDSATLLVGDGLEVEAVLPDGGDYSATFRSRAKSTTFADLTGKSRTKKALDK